MEIIALIVSFFTLLGLFIVALLGRNFMPTYVAEKAKNLASKEDLSHLTNMVERIKTLHAVEVERLKSSLSTEVQTTERRRKIYEEICHALRIFIAGHESSDEAKNKFYAAYAMAWLWASDDVLNELNQFIALLRQYAENPVSISQEQLSSTYGSTVLAMRRDTGFVSTTVQADDYQFVQFSETPFQGF